MPQYPPRPRRFAQTPHIPARRRKNPSAPSPPRRKKLRVQGARRTCGNGAHAGGRGLRILCNTWQTQIFTVILRPRKSSVNSQIRPRKISPARTETGIMRIFAFMEPPWPPPFSRRPPPHKKIRRRRLMQAEWMANGLDGAEISRKKTKSPCGLKFPKGRPVQLHGSSPRQAFPQSGGFHYSPEFPPRSPRRPGTKTGRANKRWY